MSLMTQILSLWPRACSYGHMLKPEESLCEQCVEVYLAEGPPHDEWSCSICDGGLGSPSPCGCCGSAQCSVYCGCRCASEFYCVDCGRDHDSPCRSLAEKESSATVLCGACGEHHSPPRCESWDNECRACGVFVGSGDLCSWCAGPHAEETR